MSVEASETPELMGKSRPGRSDEHARPAPAAVAADGLVFDRVERSFRGRPILKGISLTVPRGTSLLVSGRNGVGKTTLLRIAAGIITADAGSVTFEGLDPEADRRAFQRRLGFLSAGDRGLYPRLTVRQNLELWARLALLEAPRRRAAVAEAVEAFALSELAAQRTDRLSMGQRQRVRLAMTFLHAPDLVLLDEPTTSLDEEGGDRVRAAVAEVVSRGGTVVCCAPSGEGHALAFDRVIEIADGQVAA